MKGRFQEQPTRWRIARRQRKSARTLLIVLAVLFAPPIGFCLVKALEAFSMVVKGAREIGLANGEPGTMWSATLPALAVVIPGLLINALIVAAVVWIVRSLREPRQRVEPPSPYGSPPDTVARGTFHRVVARAMADRAGARLVLGGSVVALALNVGALLIGLASVDSPAGFGTVMIATSFLPPIAIIMLISAVIAFSPLIGTREELTIPSTPSAPPRHLFNALDSATIASGANQSRLHMVESPGVNAFVDDANSPQGARIFVTRGMAEALDERCLTAVFAHLLGKIEHGVTREPPMATEDGIALGPPDLIEVHRTADAQSLVALKDPEQVLDTLLAVSRCDNRMAAVQDISPACFYTWPDQRPPFDLDDRMRSLATTAGMAGRLWWEKNQAARRQTVSQQVPSDAVG